jgi:hypothetical protein
MAYDKNEIYNTAIKAAEENNLYFIEDVVAYLPCDKTTFYRLFPTESNEYNTIKDILTKNKVTQKVKMRKDWSDSENPTLQLALYKTICNDEEAHRLNGTKQEHKHTGQINIKPKEWTE